MPAFKHHYFQFYNADLVDIHKPGKGVAFMDNTLVLAKCKSLAKTNVKGKRMMTRESGGLTWAATHQCEYTVSKFAIMGLTRKREANLAG